MLNCLWGGAGLDVKTKGRPVYCREDLSFTELEVGPGA